MNIYYQLNSLPKFTNAVLTIGSFDGVHKGHQHIITQLSELAYSISGETVLLTFDPHPRIVLAEQQEKAPSVKLLTSLEEKAALLEHYGIDNLVVIPFTKAFSEQSPEAYIKDFLVEQFHPSHIVIGYDHRFGKGRQGDIAYLRKFEDQYNFKVTELSKHEVSDIAVSSTKVRKAVNLGDVALAKQLLGLPYRLTGKVVKGQQIGRSIGFPTANIVIELPYKLIPPEGIYAVLVQYDNLSYKGMLYIGNRPTVDQNLTQSIEVHIFEFQDSIYGQRLRIDFIDYLRADSKFDNLEALQTQLKQDQQAALQALATIEL